MNLAAGPTPPPEAAPPARAWLLLPWFYFLLAGFNVVAVCIGLYFSYRLQSIYVRSIQINDACATVLHDISALDGLAAAIYAPVNKVGGVPDVYEEASIQTALEKFRQTQTQLNADLEDVSPSDEEVQATKKKLVPEALALAEALAAKGKDFFGALENEDKKLADECRKEMGATYSKINGKLRGMHRHVRDIQLRFFKDQQPLIASCQQYNYGLAGLVLVMVGAATAYGRRVARQAGADHERRRLLESRAYVLKRVMGAQEEERGRISRDLHDEIGQCLTSLLLGLRSLEDAATVEAARQRAADLRQITSGALDEVRRLARGLRPAVLDDLGLSAALERFTGDYAQAHGIAVELHAEELVGSRLPGEVETALYRIVQEALTNTARHAGARQVTIRLERRPTSVRALIVDDGRGPGEIREDGGRHLGLASMRERAGLLGGRVQVIAGPAGGTVVSVSLPLGELGGDQDSSRAGG